MIAWHHKLLHRWQPISYFASFCLHHVISKYDTKNHSLLHWPVFMARSKSGKSCVPTRTSLRVLMKCWLVRATARRDFTINAMDLSPYWEAGNLSSGQQRFRISITAFTEARHQAWSQWFIGPRRNSVDSTNRPGRVWISHSKSKVLRAMFIYSDAVLGAGRCKDVWKVAEKVTRCPLLHRYLYFFFKFLLLWFITIRTT